VNAVPAPAAEPVVALARVSKRFGAVTAVEAVSLDVRRGGALSRSARTVAVHRAGTGIGPA
jgi:hypothetical protein